MKGVPVAVGLVISVLLLPVLAVAAIAGVVVKPAPAAGPTCAESAPIGSGIWRQPLRGGYRVSSRFGIRFHPVLHTTKLHTGIDLVTSGDPSIVAASAGTVVIRELNSAYGNQVVLDHGDGLQTRYAHMADRASVDVGDRVSEGAQLGVQGATGLATGSHLHFEVIKNGRPIDPAPFMAARGVPLNGRSTEVLAEIAEPRRAELTTSGPTTLATKDGRTVTLNSEQLANASLIVRTGHEVGAGSAGTVVALMAALQESGLRNLSYGDRDSLGLFQQRAGWGTGQERQNPDYASRAFFGGPVGPNAGSPPGLLDVPEWRTLRPAAAAQAVQMSAFPAAYDKWEPVAVALAGGVTTEGSRGDGCADGNVATGLLRVGTWNLCLEFCDGKLEPWRDRIPRIANVIKTQRPAVISLQETGRENSHGKALIDALAPEYKIAVYKRSKMILADPRVLSTRAQDKSQLGSVVFVLRGKGGVAQAFRDKRTGRILIVSSLHPVDGAEQQRRSEYISDAFVRVSGLAARYPGSVVIHAGDLNSVVPGSPVGTFFAGKGYRSAEQVATTRTGQQYRSYNAGRSPRRGARIDHVMVRDSEVDVKRWQQILSPSPTHLESDHNMVVTDLAMTPSAMPTGAEG